MVKWSTPLEMKEESISSFERIVQEMDEDQEAIDDQLCSHALEIYSELSL